MRRREALMGEFAGLALKWRWQAMPDQPNLDEIRQREKQYREEAIANFPFELIEMPEGAVEPIAPPVIVDGERPTLRPAPKLGEHDLALRHEFRGRPDAIRRGAAGGTKS